MFKYKDIGRIGEKIAKKYLLNLHFTILYENWRAGSYEIDLIGIKDNILHFIEVKTRRSTQYGFPEEFVDKRKAEALLHASELFLDRHPQYEDYQFDILAVHINPSTRSAIDIQFFEHIWYD